MFGLGTVINSLAIIAGGIIGSVLIFGVGINLLFGKKVSVANMLPSVLFAVAAAYLPFGF